jgi:hypothetical protein
VFTSSLSSPLLSSPLSLSLPLPSLHLAAVVRAGPENPTRRARGRPRRWWPRLVGRGQRNARMVALQQARSTPSACYAWETEQLGASLQMSRR